MKKLLLTGMFKVNEEEKAALERLGFEVYYADNEVGPFPIPIDEIEYWFCCCPFIRHRIEDFKSLKYLQTRMAGTDKFPLDYIKEHGIEFYDGIGAYGYTISEWVIMGLLFLCKHFDYFEENRVAKVWPNEKITISELYGRTAMILGSGNIGEETARKLKAFDVHTIAVNRTIHTGPYYDESYTVDQLLDLLPRCDIVCISTPLTAQTRHMITAEHFKAMKNTAIITNVARGPIIDEAAMIEALQTGEIGGAVLDAVEVEPLPADSPLWEMKNVVLTSHNSFLSDLVTHIIVKQSTERLAKWLDEHEG